MLLLILFGALLLVLTQTAVHKEPQLVRELFSLV